MRPSVDHRLQIAISIRSQHKNITKSRQSNGYFVYLRLYSHLNRRDVVVGVEVEVLYGATTYERAVVEGNGGEARSHRSYRQNRQQLVGDIGAYLQKGAMHSHSKYVVTKKESLRNHYRQSTTSSPSSRAVSKAEALNVS